MSKEQLLRKTDGGAFITSEQRLTLNEESSWLKIRKSIETLAEKVDYNDVAFFNLHDETAAGGRHSVLVAYDGKQNIANIELPDESIVVFPEQEVSVGGKFPTVLHAIEIITLIAKIANKSDLYPRLQFKKRRDIIGITNEDTESSASILPLTVHTELANVIILHQQVRSRIASGMTLLAASCEVSKQFQLVFV